MIYIWIKNIVKGKSLLFASYEDVEKKFIIYKKNQIKIYANS